MTRLRTWMTAATALLAASGAAAQTAERWAAGGAAEFGAAIAAAAPAPSRPLGLLPRTGFSASPIGLLGSDSFDRYLRDHAGLPPQEGSASPPAAGAIEVDLARLLNKQWRTDAVFTLGGLRVVIGGAFDREQNAYIGLQADGWKEPQFFNIKSLVSKEERLKVGNATYVVSLSANPVKPMKSQIVFENQADETEQHRITMRRLLDALVAAGEPVQLSDQLYRTFYYNDVRNGGVDPATRTFALILSEGEDLHVFLIPAELVPGDKVAVFKMHKNKRVGLQVAGGKLRVFENP